MAITDSEDLKQKLRLQLLANSKCYRQQLLQRLLELPDSDRDLINFTTKF